MSTFQICFVCSANICRSPYAEARMRQMVDEAGLADVVTVSSAGTFGIEGASAHPRSIEIAVRQGASLHEFRSRGITGGIISAAHLIVCMESRHILELARAYPDAQPRMRLLRSSRTGVGGSDVPDPVGMTDVAYDASLAVIDDALIELLPEIRRMLGSVNKRASERTP